MFEYLRAFLVAPIPVWCFLCCAVLLWTIDRDRTRWIRKIAQTVDKMDSDENGWCRHDPVSIREDETYSTLLKLLTPDKKDKK